MTNVITPCAFSVKFCLLPGEAIYAAPVAIRTDAYASSRDSVFFLTGIWISVSHPLSSS